MRPINEARLVQRADGTAPVTLDQRVRATADPLTVEWASLGEYAFAAGLAG